jgi:hypothetical protein
LDRKLKETSRRLHSWSDKKVGHVASQLALAKELLHKFETAQDHIMLSPAENWLKNKLKMQSLLLASFKRTMDRLRSRISWLKEGDANTKYFHMHARHRKRKNLVTKLKDGDNILTSHHEKAGVVDLFYSKLIGHEVERDRSINLEALELPVHDLADLELPVSELEIWETIKTIPSDKATGPDGFTGRFYKVCWNIIKQEVMNVVAALWNRNSLNLSKLNSAYITMVPKVEGADQVKDFRPISLVHIFAKLVTKILANRLGKKLNNMVSPIQSAFIKGRFIQDNFMLVQQTARLFHSQSKARLLFKLDITKAFDSISWPFLIEVMKQMGFGDFWRDIICGLFGSSSTQVLLNGCPGKKFSIEGDSGREITYPQYFSFLSWMSWVCFSLGLRKLDYFNSYV